MYRGFGVDLVMLPRWGRCSWPPLYGNVERHV